ncbi:MAG: PilZ domain-containing protein [Deltaproteobacteria bacterium]|nr:PilZ domain-containing protein [Deltaproteobacteria bacterium]
MNFERRTSPRIPLDIGVRKKGSRFFIKYSGDISLRGVFLNTAIPLPKGEKVELELKLGDEEPIYLKGEVLAQRPDETGLGVSIIFSEIKDVDKKRIEEYINSVCVIKK